MTKDAIIGKSIVITNKAAALTEIAPNRRLDRPSDRLRNTRHELSAASIVTAIPMIAAIRMETGLAAAQWLNVPCEPN